MTFTICIWLAIEYISARLLNLYFTNLYFSPTGAKAKYNFDESDEDDDVITVPGTAPSIEDDVSQDVNNDVNMSDGSDFDFAPTKSSKPT